MKSSVADIFPQRMPADAITTKSAMKDIGSPSKASPGESQTNLKYMKDIGSSSKASLWRG